MSESVGVAITMVLCALAIVNIVGNSLVCLIVKRNRDMRIPINYLIVNLAAADIMFAMFLAPKIILSMNFTHPKGMAGTIVCKLLTGGNMAWVGGISSIVTLNAIAIERYYAVVYPLGNKGKLTKRKLKVIIPGSWIFSLIFNIPMFLSMNLMGDFCRYVWPEEWMAKTNTVVWDALVVVSLALMIGLYSRVVYTLWFKRNDDNQLTNQQRGVTRVRKRVTLMVVSVSVIFGMCWTPMQVSYFLMRYASYQNNPVQVAITNTLVLFNSAVNPFVYALLNQQFREKIKKMICCAGPISPRIQASEEPQEIELSNGNNHSSGAPTHPARTAGPCSQE